MRKVLLRSRSKLFFLDGVIIIFKFLFSGGLFNLGVRLMQLFSKDEHNYEELTSLLGKNPALKQYDQFTLNCCAISRNFYFLI